MPRKGGGLLPPSLLCLCVHCPLLRSTWKVRPQPPQGNTHHTHTDWGRHSTQTHTHTDRPYREDHGKYATLPHTDWRRHSTHTHIDRPYREDHGLGPGLCAALRLRGREGRDAAPQAPRSAGLVHVVARLEALQHLRLICTINTKKIKNQPLSHRTNQHKHLLSKIIFS